LQTIHGFLSEETFGPFFEWECAKITSVIKLNLFNQKASRAGIATGCQRCRPEQLPRRQHDQGGERGAADLDEIMIALIVR
jgi:hypothetical protein